MTFDWTSEDETPKMPEGFHRVRIERVMRAKKDGTEFSNKDGDPSLLVIFGNGNGEEIGDFCDLAGKHTWKLKRLCQRFGLDVQKMKDNNITPMHFERQDWAEKQLVGREGWIDVVRNGKYLNAEPVHENDVPVDLVKQYRQPVGSPPTRVPVSPQRAMQYEQHEPADESSIPF